MRSSEKKSLFRNCVPVIAVFLIFLTASCSKKNNSGSGTTNPGTANIAFVNASPTTSSYNIYSGSTNLTPAGGIAYGSVSGASGGSPYLGLVPGTDSIRVSANGTTYVVDTAVNISNNGYYTLFVYDTVNSSGHLKALLLNDPSTLPTSGQAEVRFINLSSNSAPLFVSLINGTDTIHDNNLTYVGSGLLSADSLSAFMSINPGTYTVAVQNNEGTRIADTSSFSFAANSVYTLYAKGYQNGLNGTDSLSVGIIKNY